jgi:hypothetical protein
MTKSRIKHLPFMRFRHKRGALRGCAFLLRPGLVGPGFSTRGNDSRCDNGAGDDQRAALSHELAG